jgi:transcriptional regulator with XRE-family HTH domain
MDITICNNLKELRKKKNNTQEDLADFLSISIAAVSKWERGESYPDIELLPRIAVFYDTTVDDLLGVSEERKNHKLREYHTQMHEFWKTGDSLACVELWRNAAKEFPNDNNVMFQLLQALTNATNGPFAPDDKSNEAKEKEYFKEAVEIGEVLSAKANDQSIIYSTLSRLSFAYKGLGEVEKAVKIANKLPHVWSTNESILTHILEGAELKAHLQSFLLSLIGSFGNIMGNLRRCDYDDEQTLKIYGNAIEIIKLLFEDGDYGVQHTLLNSMYLTLAETYGKLNDTDAFFENLSAAAKHAIAYDLLEENVLYTSLLFNVQKIQKHGRTSMDNESQYLLKRLAEKHFDFCSDDERFVEIRNRLMAVACEDVNTH